MPNTTERKVQFKRTKARDVDQESKRPKLTTSRRKVQPPPETDSDEHISDQSDSEIEQELDMPAKDDTRRKTMTPRKSSKSQEKDTSSQTAIHSNKESKTEETNVSAAPYAIIASSMYHMKIAPITFSTASTYIPSFYLFFFALNSAHRVVHENTYLRYLAPNYITVASNLYYGFLGIIQILRAKTVAGNITRGESQALRRFEREFPFESLPIMSPLILFFQNLGAVKLPDPMYTWITPTLPITLGTGPNTDGIFTNDTNVMLPNIPALIRFLYEIGTSNTVDQITQGNYIVPSSRAAGNNNFFGINLGPNQQGQANFQRLVYSAGFLAPPELPSQIDVKVLQRISRWDLPQLTTATDLSTLAGFLQTDGNMEWFKNLIIIASAEAKFFHSSTNFSVISPTTGLASLIETRFVNPVANEPVAVDDIYPFSNYRFNSDIWKIDARTTRGTTDPEDFKIGATTQLLAQGIARITPPGHIKPTFTSNGPYFDPAMLSRAVIQQESDTTRSPIVALEQIIRANLYDETGGQIKNQS